jgi:hypothetical protein
MPIVSNRLVLDTSPPKSNPLLDPALANIGDKITDIVNAINLGVGVDAYQNANPVYIEGHGISTFVDPVADEIIDSISISQFRSVEYQVVISTPNEYQMTKLFIIHDGINVDYSELGEVNTNGSLVTFSPTIVNGNLELFVTTVGANTTIKFYKMQFRI